MGNARWFWIGAVGLLAWAVYWGVGQAVNPSGGEAEFQKTLGAIRQVKSFRGAYVDTASPQHSERLWELDCNRIVLHQQSHASQTSADSPFEMSSEELLVGDQIFIHHKDGSWEKASTVTRLYTAKWYCDNLVQGSVRDLLPDFNNLTRHAMIQKGDKKSVNGVQCRVWNYGIRSTTAGTQSGSVCIGLDDHLPYEMITDKGGRYSYSDYNRPIEFDAPDGVLPPESSAEGSS